MQNIIKKTQNRIQENKMYWDTNLLIAIDKSKIHKDNNVNKGK